ncbi:MAG: hypothetical protein C4291_00080 [Candidatus Dadabacteria bacterium]
MKDKLLVCPLWFNSGKATMKNKLPMTIGKSEYPLEFLIKNISILKIEYVLLYFDNGTIGQARVKKKSWVGCTHLINICMHW